MNKTAYKLLILIDGLEAGGAEKFVFDIARQLSKDKFSLTVANLGSPGIYSRRLEENKIRVINFGAGRYNPFVFFKVLGFVRKEKIDLLHGHLLKANLLALLAKPFLSSKIVIHQHSGLTNIALAPVNRFIVLQNAYRFLFRKLVRYADMMVVPSEKGMTLYSSYARKILVVPNGVDFSIANKIYEERKTIREAKRRLLQLDPAMMVLGTVGRLSPVKKQETMIMALKNLVEQNFNVKLIIIGDGSLKEDLISLASKLNISDRVIFLGYQADIFEWLACMDIFVLSSEYETFPIALLEAMTMGVPVVSTACDGPCRIIQSHQNGIIVPIGDPVALNEALARMIRTPEEMKRMAEKGRQDAVTKYDIKNITAQLEGIYESVIENKDEIQCQN